MSNLSENSGYFSRPDGVSGMNVSALANFCGVAQQTITQILNRIRDSDPITNTLEDCLKPYAGKELRLITNDPQGRLIIVDEVCQAILEYYVFDARSYDGKDIAKNNFRVISKAGMRLFIWSQTGYIPSELRQDKQDRKGFYWYKRIGLAMSDIVNPLPVGYFCVYQEMMRFFSELEMRLGYIFPDKDFVTDKYIVVDISIGRTFSDWLRNEDEDSCQARQEFLNSTETIDFRRPSSKIPEGGKNRHELVEYNHVYPEESHGENNIQLANGYPNKYRGIFNYYLEEYYIPDRFLNYIKKRDSQGIEEAKKNLLAMPDSVRLSLSGTLVGRFIQNLLPPSK